MNGNVNDGGCVFGKDRKPRSTEVLTDWAHKAGPLIGEPSLHPHDFRHTGSPLLRSNGCSIEHVSELLNHSSLEVTQKFYLRLFNLVPSGCLYITLY